MPHGLLDTSTLTLDPITYRDVRTVDDEGPAFRLVLDEVAAFYIGVMGGRVRPDAPGTRLKWSRDWEYPWIVTRSGVHAGQRVLDCGAGYSPVPFLLAKRGGTVTAVDRDAVVCSRPRWALRAAGRWLADVARLPFAAAAALAGPGAAPTREPAGAPRPASGPAARPPSSGPVRRARRFLVHRLVERHRASFARIWRPDFWGPVSPRLLKRFGVRYTSGDLTALPFDDGHFDVVTCVSVLEHLSPEAQALGVREMARVLRPGGRLLITYDRHDVDLTAGLIRTAGLGPVELACLHAPPAPGAPRRPDVIGMDLRKAPRVP